MYLETWIPMLCSKITLDINQVVDTLLEVSAKKTLITNYLIRKENQKEVTVAETIMASPVAIPTCSNFSKSLLNNKVTRDNSTDLVSKVVYLNLQTQVVQVDPVIADGLTKAGLEAHGRAVTNLFL